MIYIGICDDEKIYQRNMETCCEHFFANKNISYRIVLFSSGEEVLTYQEHELLVLLLDIEMNTGMDGIRVMNLIRHNNYIRSIILYLITPIMFLIRSARKHSVFVQNHWKKTAFSV